MFGRVIAVTGGKGGVGKSTTTINLAVSLRLDDYSVAVVDADVEMPNLVEMLDVRSPTTIHDVLSGRAEPTEALVKVGERFAVLPGDSSLSGYGSIEPERLSEVVDTLDAAYDFVLLDTGAGLSYDDLFPLALADEIILVSSPDPAALENAKRTQAFIRRLNQRVGGIVITKATGPLDDGLLDDFDAELLGVIPKEEVVSRSTAAGKPLELVAPDSDAAQAYREVEARLTDGRLPPKHQPASTPAGADDGPDEAEAENEEPAAAATTTPEEPEEEPQKTGLVRRLLGLNG